MSIPFAQKSEFHEVRDAVISLASADMPFWKIERFLSETFSPFMVRRAIQRIKYDRPEQILLWMQSDREMPLLTIAQMQREARRAAQFGD